MIAQNYPILSIFVLIEQAHTAAWPTKITPQLLSNGFITYEDTLDNRIMASKKAKIKLHNHPYMFVDTMDNEVQNTLQSWPDVFYLINREKKILSISQYKNGQLLLNMIDVLRFIIAEYAK